MNIDLTCVQRVLDWLKKQLYLDAISGQAKTRLVKRGQVYRCNFGCGIGSEMQKERPAVIIQNDPNNRSSGNTIVVPITHDSSNLSCMAALTPQYNPEGVMILDGQANTSNLMCVSKARLGDYICDLPAKDLKKIDEALAKTIDLMKYYADINDRYEAKIKYVDSVKQARNSAQDELSAIRKELGIDENEDIIAAVRNLKNDR